MDWKNRDVLVTGGTSFIGSGIVDSLVAKGARVKVVDDLSSGKLDNIEKHIAEKRVAFVEADLREPGVAERAVQGMNVVFHLAADHGGRGYVDLHQAGPASNFFLDGLVFRRSRQGQSRQSRLRLFRLRLSQFPAVRRHKEVYLTEDMTGLPTTPTTPTAGPS